MDAVLTAGAHNFGQNAHKRKFTSSQIFKELYIKYAKKKLPSYSQKRVHSCYTLTL